MKKSYCTQKNGDCTTCTFVNYGLDCANNPIQGMYRKGTKEDRAMAAFDGHKGQRTISHIKKIIGKELCDRLTGRELGLVMSAVNRAYHEGRASTGAEVIDGSYVWVNCLDKGYDIDVLQRLVEIETPTYTKVYYDGNLNIPINHRYMTRDDMPYEDQINARDMRYVPHDEWEKWYYREYKVVRTWELREIAAE